MRRLRVCHLSKYYPPAPGGIETHVRTLARAQAEQGVEASVYCVNHEGATTSVERDGPVEVTRFGRAVGAAKLDICPGLAPALARTDADLLHLHAPGPTMTLALFRARPDRPLVVTYHSDVVRQKVRAALFRPIERSVYRRVASILTTSPPYAGGSRFLRPYRDRVHVLPHGIDLAPYLDPAPAHLAESRAIRARYAGPIWLGCGRMVYYKGFTNAIRAMADVPGTLLLSGDGPDAPALRAEAEALGLSGRVVFLGNLPHYLDLIPYYLAADAFWFPSNARSEAFGLVQVEAMACGVPVINAAIPHSGVDWVSPHGETGLTVPLNDPVALAAAARRLLDEPGLRDRLGAAARERAVREFDHRVMARRSLELYEAALGGRPVPRPIEGDHPGDEAPGDPASAAPSMYDALNPS